MIFLNISIVMIKYIALLISLWLTRVSISTQSNTKNLKSGSTFQLQCPIIVFKQLTSMRTYALILNNAQKNMQIRIYIKQKTNAFKKIQDNKDQQKQISTDDINQNRDEIQQKPKCILNRNSKICVLDGFISQFHAKCSSSGSVSMLVVEPAMISPLALKNQKIIQKAIAPILDLEEKAVVIFQPHNTIELGKIDMSQIFISNCIESIEFYQHYFLLGIKGKQFIQIIMTSEQITGQWSFATRRTQDNQYDHPIQTYNLPDQNQIFQVQKKESQLQDSSQYYYYGFKILICSENKSKIQNMSINITVTLKIETILSGQSQINQSIMIKQGQLINKIPIKLAFFYYQHSILSVNLSFSHTTHYIFQLSQPKSLSSESTIGPPIIQQDQFLFYSYEKNKIQKISIQAHIIKSYRQKMTPALKIISSGIQKVYAELLETHIQGQYFRQNEIKNQSKNQIKIQNGKILPIFVNNSQSYAQISLKIQTLTHLKIKQQKSQQFSYFKLILQTSFIPIQISIGQEITEFLFQNDVKRFVVPKQKMQLLKSKKMKVLCTQCHAFLTYNSDCSSINCCQYAHADQVDVKPSSLMIITASTGHTTQTALIKLKLLQDQKAFTLIAGKIVQGLLLISDTYIYISDGKSDLEIIFNSQVQSILLLVKFSQDSFPNKTSFDYQSNQGYIRIPATKMKKNIYIRLLKMISTYQHIDGNYKIPYSIVILNEQSKLQLIQGRQFSHLLMKNSQKEYLTRHPCNTQQNLYLRIHLKSYSSAVGSSNLQITNTAALQVQINPGKNQKLTNSKKIMVQDTLDVTNYLIKPNQDKFNNKQYHQICEITVKIKNILPQTLHLSLMFFKQKQIYQIHAGQFMQDHILAGRKLMLFCVVNPLRSTNIYAYSSRLQFFMKTTLISVSQLKFILSNEQINNDKNNNYFSANQNYNKQNPYKTIYSTVYSQASHSQFQYIRPTSQLQTQIQNNTQIKVVMIQILKDSQQKGFQRNDIFVICTQNQTNIRIGNRLQYQLQNENTHVFSYPLSTQIFEGDKQKTKEGSKNSMIVDSQIILQNIKLNGKYLVAAKIKYFGEVITTLKLQNSDHIRPISKSTTIKESKLNNEEPIFTFKTQQIKTKLSQYCKSNLLNKNNKIYNESTQGYKFMHKPLSLTQFFYSNLFLQFQITCTNSANKNCMFLTSLQTSQSDIRQLIPGVPEAFHINKHSSIIFIYNNMLDRQFKFKVNRKLGFPNYKLCSYRTNSQQNFSQKLTKNKKSQFTFDGLDKCLPELKNPQNQLNLRIQQNAFNQDSNFIVGRTHQLIINQYNEQYCTNCTYYLGLYSDYSVVEGSIFVMNSNQGTYLEQGSSITTIVYRGEPDKYILVNWQSLMAIVYELQGTVQVQVFYFDKQNGTKIIVLQKEDLSSYANKQKSQNVIPINLLNQSGKLDQHDYQLQIQPANKMPSALYTLVIMNKEQQIINIKDGVPYQMKYTLQNETKMMNPVIKYRYLCQNQGIIMVNTKDFDDLDLQLRCRDDITQIQHVKDANSTNFGKQYKNQKTEEGKLIDISELLITKKKYKMSNKLDINIAPKICNRYQLKITSKTPSISYSILVSSTDIISLPLNKQIPGILKYQTKIYQIYQISVNQKTEVRCTFKFCQGGQGRIMIAKSKKNIFSQIYEEEVQIYPDTTFETLKYRAKPGLFYIKVQFKSRGGIMEYTIHAESTYKNSNYKPLTSISDTYTSNSQWLTNSLIKIYKNLNQISYKVKRVGYDFTKYEIQFYKIIQDYDLFQIEYFIVQSTKLNLLKKTQNCNGQYFVELVNHHEQIKQTKITIHKNDKKVQPKDPKLGNFSIKQRTENNQVLDSDMKITFEYSTTTPYAYITIIPIVFNKKSHQFYHLYIPKYHEVQLTNGQIFARVSYILGEIAFKIEQFVDIHGSEDIILITVGLLLFGCIIGALFGGIWFGSRYFYKTRTVYVLKQVRQQQNDDQNQQEDNRIEDQMAYNNNNNTLATIIASEKSNQILQVHLIEDIQVQNNTQSTGKQMIKMQQRQQIQNEQPHIKSLQEQNINPDQANINEQ